MTDLHDELAWYALRSKPNKERLLWKQVRARDFEIYYPRIFVDPVDPRSRKIRPFFPGYMFVRADLSRVGPSTFNYMPYSIGLVSFGGRAASIQSEVIEAIRRQIGDVTRAEDTRADRFKKGDRVTVTEGPFEGYEGLFDKSLSGSHRVRILLELLSGRSVATELDARHLEHSNRDGQQK